MGMAMKLGKKEGSREKKKKKLRILLLFFFFVKEFGTNSFSTTSRALAHKGAETHTKKKRNGRKRKQEHKKEAKLRSKAPGQRVSMRSV